MSRLPRYPERHTSIACVLLDRIDTVPSLASLINESEEFEYICLAVLAFSTLALPPIPTSDSSSSDRVVRSFTLGHNCRVQVANFQRCYLLHP